LAENLYEGMFLLDSGQFASDPDGTAQAVTDLLQKAGGTLVAQRPWQDGRLAYDIAGRRKGLHYLAYFRMDPEKVTGLNRACRLNDRILRHLLIQQPQTLFDAMVAALTGEAQPEADDAPEPAVVAVDVVDDES
jgi:small subunit ribosomal protein S6